MQNNIIPRSQNGNYNELMELDIWKYDDIEVLHDLIIISPEYNKKCKYFVLDFSTIYNLNLQNEVKMFLCDEIEKKSNYILNHTSLRRLISFLSGDKFGLLKSILDLSLFDCNESLEVFIRDNDIITIKTKKKIDKQIQIREYKSNHEILRLFGRFYGRIDFLTHKTQGVIKEANKWYIDELGFKVNKPDTSSNNTISFYLIRMDGLRNLAKEICWHELITINVGTALQHLYNFSTFCCYLLDNYPRINSFSIISNDIIDKYYIWLRTESGLGSKAIGAKMFSINNAISLCRKYQWEDISNNMQEYEYNVRTKKKVPDPFSDLELNQINEHLDDLPKTIGRMVCLMQLVGIRISDLCGLRIEDLRKDGEKNCFLWFRQNKPGHPAIVPVDGIPLELLKSAIDDTRKYHGDKAKYIFSLEDKELVKPVMVDRLLKELAYKYKITDNTGILLNPKTGRFRKTVGTKMAEMGIRPEAIAKLLGQKGIGNLQYYISIRDDKYIEELDPVLNDYNSQIANIGKKPIHEDVSNLPIGLPLSNGYCRKSITESLCKHANSCYRCKMFRYDKEYLPVYKLHLKKAQNNYEIAKREGFERQMQINEDLIESISEIIEKLNVSRKKDKE